MRRARWLARIDFADMCSRCIPHSVGKPDSRIIFVIVNQNVTKYLIVFQCEDCSLCSQCSNLIFTRSLWYSRFGGCCQNVRFSNGFRRIPLHRKISNVCIEDRVLSNEIWWFRMTMNVVLVLQSCCPPRCYRILGGCSNVCYVVVGPIRLNEIAGCPSRIVILSYFVILLFDPSKYQINKTFVILLFDPSK